MSRKKRHWARDTAALRELARMDTRGKSIYYQGKDMSKWTVTEVEG